MHRPGLVSGTQLYLTLCDPMDCSPLDSSVHGILQARILAWVAVSSPGCLPNPGTEPGSPVLQAVSLVSEPPEKPPGLVYSIKIMWTHSYKGEEFKAFYSRILH